MEKSTTITKALGLLVLSATLLGSAVAHGWNLRELKVAQDEISGLKVNQIIYDRRINEVMILLTEIKGDVKGLKESFDKHELRKLP